MATPKARARLESPAKYTISGSVFDAKPLNVRSTQRHWRSDNDQRFQPRQFDLVYRPDYDDPFFPGNFRFAVVSGYTLASPDGEGGRKHVTRTYHGWTTEMPIWLQDKVHENNRRIRSVRMLRTATRDGLLKVMEMNELHEKLYQIRNLTTRKYPKINTERLRRMVIDYAMDDTHRVLDMPSEALLAARRKKH